MGILPFVLIEQLDMELIMPLLTGLKQTGALTFLHVAP